MKKNNDFQLKEKVTQSHLTEEEKVVVTDQDFQLVNTSDYSHDQKFETKPTTFLKDSVKRFSKNKSSVVATYILGILLLCSVVVPIIDRSDVNKPSPYQIYLEPKLFDAGTGFWDGTREYTNIAYDPVNECPDPADFNINAVSNLKVNPEVSFVNSYSKFATGGYIKFGRKADDINEDAYLENIGFQLDTSVSNTLQIVFHEEEMEYVQPAPYRIDFLYDDEFGITPLSVLGDFIYYDGVIPDETATPVDIFSSVTLVNDNDFADYINATAEIVITVEIIQANETGYNLWANQYDLPTGWDPLELA